MPAGKRTGRNLTGEDKTTSTGYAPDNTCYDSSGSSDMTGQVLRQRASQRLISISGLTIDAIEAMSAQDVKRQFHELQVHQVELEMQNDELHRAQEALQSDRARYSDLYEQAPVGYFSVNEAGLILQIHQMAASPLLFRKLPL